MYCLKVVSKALCVCVPWPSPHCCRRLASDAVMRQLTRSLTWVVVIFVIIGVVVVITRVALSLRWNHVHSTTLTCINKHLLVMLSARSYRLAHLYNIWQRITLTTRRAWQSQTWGRPAPQVRVQNQFQEDEIPLAVMAGRMKNFSENTSTIPEVMDSSTLNFKANFKCSRFFLGGGTPVPFRVCANKPLSISSVCKGRSTP